MLFITLSHYCESSELITVVIITNVQIIYLNGFNTRVLASEGWREAYQHSSKVSRILYRSQTKLKDPRWAWCEQVHIMWYFPFSALTLLIRRQEGHPACKTFDVGLLVVTIWSQLCMSYSSRCHHHLRHPKFAPIYRLTEIHLENGHSNGDRVALTLLVGWQEGHLACKIMHQKSPNFFGNLTFFGWFPVRQKWKVVEWMSWSFVWVCSVWCWLQVV